MMESKQALLTANGIILTFATALLLVDSSIWIMNYGAFVSITNICVIGSIILTAISSSNNDVYEYWSKVLFIIGTIWFLITASLNFIASHSGNNPISWLTDPSWPAFFFLIFITGTTLGYLVGKSKR